jgi:small-conductance mechanosensitive channel
LLLLSTIWFGICVQEVSAQDKGDPPPLPIVSNNRVILDDKPLFEIPASNRGQTREERAAKISETLKSVANNRSIELDKLQIVDRPNLDTTEIVAGDKVILGITETDAQLLGKERKRVAQQILEILKDAIAEYREAYSPQQILIAVGKAALATLILLLLLRFGNRAYRFLHQQATNRYGAMIRTIRIGSRDFLKAEQIRIFLARLSTLVRLGIFLTLISVYLNTVLSFFPQTRSVSVGLFSSIFAVFGQLLQGTLGYIPKLIFLIIFSYITFYVLKFVNFLFLEVESGEVQIPGFEREWAMPTSRITQFLVLTFFGMVAFPYLPGAGSDAFQGISIFLGILISLGSSSAITNIIAGILLTYTRAFRIGDRVDIGGVIGVVMEKGLLVTRLMIDTNHFVNIPNGNVLSTNVTNFRIDNLKDGENTPPPIVSLLVSISYEIPWQKVYNILLETAQTTNHVLEEPPPEVIHHALHQDHVVYELSVYTNNFGEDESILSDLRRGIHERCYTQGIPLVIPRAIALQNGN